MKRTAFVFALVLIPVVVAAQTPAKKTALDLVEKQRSELVERRVERHVRFLGTPAEEAIGGRSA